MFAEKSHKTVTALVVVATTTAIVFYSEQALASERRSAASFDGSGACATEKPGMATVGMSMDSSFALCA